MSAFGGKADISRTTLPSICRITGPRARAELSAEDATMPFRDRSHAGRKLAKVIRLAHIDESTFKALCDDELAEIERQSHCAGAE